MNDLSRYSTYQVMLSIDGGPNLIPSPDGRWVEYRDVSDHIQSMQSSIDALERLRPHWAQGYSSDSMAAQASTSALSQIWALLGVTDQTAAMSKLVQLQLALGPLAIIADAYDANGLDEARPDWRDPINPAEVELFSGRGGKRLLTLQNAMDARTALKHAAVKQPDDTATGGEGNGLAITGRLRDAYKGAYFGGDVVLTGKSYGHARFADGDEIHTSNIVEELGNGLFRTKSGSIYKVEFWSAQYVKDQMNK